MSLKKTITDYRIVVLPRGHVLIGNFEQLDDACVLKSASVIRRWGTTQGLGELAEKGPLSETKLDPCNGVVRFNANAVIFTIDTEAALWVK